MINDIAKMTNKEIGELYDEYQSEIAYANDHIAELRAEMIKRMAEADVETKRFGGMMASFQKKSDSRRTNYKALERDGLIEKYVLTTRYHEKVLRVKNEVA